MIMTAAGIHFDILRVGGRFPLIIQEPAPTAPVCLRITPTRGIDRFAWTEREKSESRPCVFNS